MIVSSNWFAIRADADTRIGLGHVMRCIALAEWAADLGIACVLLTRSELSPIQDMLSRLAIGVSMLGVKRSSSVGDAGPYQHSHWLPVNEIEDASESLCVLRQQALVKGAEPLFVVVDHYALGAPWETHVMEFAPVLAVDDLNNRPHHCHWLLDQTLGKSDSDYTGLVNDDCQVLLGPKFALLRKEFSLAMGAINRDPINSQEKGKLLVSLGGCDEKNITKKIVERLEHCSEKENWSVTVLVGAGNPYGPELEVLLKEFSFDVSLLRHSNHMASLMLAHDICIGAAGSSTWERCALGLPSMLVILADNQKHIAENVHAVGGGINLGKADTLTAAGIDYQLQKLYQDNLYYMDFVKNARMVCDGVGCNRVLTKVLEF